MRVGVLQPWMEKIPIRMQSTLILGLRGPDVYAVPNVKKICRWLRGLAFKPGNPANLKEFMNEDPPFEIVEKGETAKELEFLPQHFYVHLLHSLEVVAYRHPSEAVRSRGFGLFRDMCALLHLPVESRSKFENRLRMIKWPGDRQPNDFQGASDLLGSNAN